MTKNVERRFSWTLLHILSARCCYIISTMYLFWSKAKRMSEGWRDKIHTELCRATSKRCWIDWNQWMSSRQPLTEIMQSKGASIAVRGLTVSFWHRKCGICSILYCVTIPSASCSFGESDRSTRTWPKNKIRPWFSTGHRAGHHVSSTCFSEENILWEVTLLICQGKRMPSSIFLQQGLKMKRGKETWL